jgi:hypothetical protein
MGMRRAHLALAWIVTATLFLAACGGNEGQQRKAFTEFLQTRILDKPGVHVPKLSDEERAQFGPYADHYAVITAFNEAMDKSVSPKLSAAVSSGSIRSLSDVVVHRDRLEAAKAGIDEMGRALSDALAQADAAHAKLDQPADLKPVYDKAYDRLVTQPASAFRDIVPVMDKVLGEAVDLGAYIDAHRGKVRVSGPMIETSDPAIQAAINDRLQSLQSNQQAVQSAQARLQSVVYGR